LPTADAAWLAPPVAFHFTVSFGTRPPGVDGSFQEISGISPEMEIETVTEGGENRFVHQLPKGVKAGKLTLKRGVAPMDSPLITWCLSVLEGGLVRAITPKLLHVFLLGADGSPLRVWSVANAWPVRWQVEAFNSTKNELALEQVELAYAYVKREV
jgi:phage tail-like protein